MASNLFVSFIVVILYLCIVNVLFGKVIRNHFTGENSFCARVEKYLHFLDTLKKLCTQFLWHKRLNIVEQICKKEELTATYDYLCNGEKFICKFRSTSS